MRAWVEARDLTLVTAAQSWRVGGALFLPLGLHGLLPLEFALRAGLGDVLVGVIAPFVARATERRTPGWRRASAWLIALGLLDFAGAFGTGIASSSAGFLHAEGSVGMELIEVLPLVLIPTFLVPAWIILHLMAWLRLARS
jgi:hypothetical protein